MLPNGAHLRDPQRLTQRKMGANHEQARPVPPVLYLRDHRATMAITGQIEQVQVLKAHLGAEKEDRPEKAMALQPRGRSLALMRMIKSRAGRNPVKV